MSSVGVGVGVYLIGCHLYKGDGNFSFLRKELSLPNLCRTNNLLLFLYKVPCFLII